MDVMRFSPLTETVRQKEEFINIEAREGEVSEKSRLQRAKASLESIPKTHRRLGDGALASGLAKSGVATSRWVCNTWGSAKSLCKDAGCCEAKASQNRGETQNCGNLFGLMPLRHVEADTLDGTMLWSRIPKWKSRANIAHK
jgi:hypothetical protein